MTASEAYLMAYLIDVADEVTTGDHTMIVHFEHAIDRDGTVKMLRQLRGES